eukprot:CAMPEP_0167756936 /NCGR_PEP_ID=MMETSP0110_2-20121227/9654_1 /TAXON_ID=629695 /ORGANISM="Gymnochlora sp., Strain CCMP2014" /LENGTH=591 /DNA_ID=CAMNT_0007643085 /DNA_START=136 /DNA_END=1911 /DNA_ORIENTATION=+
MDKRKKVNLEQGESSEPSRHGAYMNGGTGRSFMTYGNQPHPKVSIGMNGIIEEKPARHTSELQKNHLPREEQIRINGHRYPSGDVHIPKLSISNSRHRLDSKHDIKDDVKIEIRSENGGGLGSQHSPRGDQKVVDGDKLIGDELDEKVATPHLEGGSYASQEKSRIMQEQATRRAAINKEQQNILMMMEKEDAFWRKQEDRFKMMVKRQNVAKRTSEDLQQFVNKWNKVMMSHAQGYRNLTLFGREETGTLRQACIAQGILSKSLADHFSEMRERIFTDTGREATDLSKNMFTTTKQLETSGKRLSKVIKTARVKCMDSWVSYAKAVNERQRLELAGKPVTRDPFVACRLYDRDVASLRKQEMQYRKEMTRLFRDFKVEDGRRIDKTQSIVLDYLLSQKAMLEDAIKFTESAIDAVKGIDREADVNEFIRQADLVVAPSSDTKGSKNAPGAVDNVFEIQPPHRDPKTLTRLYAQECQCQGSLYRQGKFLKTWKKSHVVLSRSGFFHQFDSKNAVQPEISIRLRDCHVSLAPKEDPCAFEIIEPSRGFFSVVGSGPTRHCYKADSEEELVDWMIAMKKHIPESAIKIKNDSE